MSTLVRESISALLFLVIFITIIVITLYAALKTVGFDIDKLQSEQFINHTDNAKDNSLVNLKPNDSRKFQTYLDFFVSRFRTQYLILYVTGFGYAFITHIFIFLATCTSSHNGMVDIFEQPQYSVYGLSFANLYYDYAFIMMVIMIGFMCFFSIFSHRLLFIKKYSEQIFYIYQLSFILLFFIPAGIISCIFTISPLLDSVFNHFIDFKEINDNNQHLVYTLQKDITNPRLGQTSYFRFIKLIFWNFLGLSLWSSFNDFLKKVD